MVAMLSDHDSRYESILGLVAALGHGSSVAMTPILDRGAYREEEIPIFQAHFCEYIFKLRTRGQHITADKLNTILNQLLGPLSRPIITLSDTNTSSLKQNGIWAAMHFLLSLASPLQNIKDKDTMSNNDWREFSAVEVDVFERLPKWSTSTSQSEEGLGGVASSPKFKIQVEDYQSLDSILNKAPGFRIFDARLEQSRITKMAVKVPFTEAFKTELESCPEEAISQSLSVDKKPDNLFGGLSHSFVSGFNHKQVPTLNLVFPDLPKNKAENLWLAAMTEDNDTTNNDGPSCGQDSVQSTSRSRKRFTPSSDNQYKDPVSIQDIHSDTSDTLSGPVFLSEKDISAFESAYALFRGPERNETILTEKELWTKMSQILIGVCLPMAMIDRDTNGDRDTVQSTVRLLGCGSGALSSYLRPILEVGSYIRELEVFSEVKNDGGDCIQHGFRSAVGSFLQGIRAHSLYLVDLYRKQQSGLLSLSHAIQPIHSQLRQVWLLCGHDHTTSCTSSPLPNGLLLIDKLFSFVVKDLQSEQHLHLFFLQACLGPYMGVMEQLLFEGITEHAAPLLGLVMNPQALKEKNESMWLHSLKITPGISIVPEFLSAVAEPILACAKTMLLIAQADPTNPVLTHSLRHPIIRGALSTRESEIIKKEWDQYYVACIDDSEPINNEPSTIPLYEGHSAYTYISLSSSLPAVNTNSNTIITSTFPIPINNRQSISTRACDKKEKVYDTLSIECIDRARDKISHRNKLIATSNSDVLKHKQPIKGQSHALNTHDNDSIMAVNQRAEQQPNGKEFQFKHWLSPGSTSFELRPQPWKNGHVPPGNNAQFLPLVLRESLVQPIATQSRLANKAILTLLFSNHKLMGHLRALQRYLLMGNGDMFNYLCARVFRQMSAGQCPTPADNYANLLNALAVSTSQADPYANALFLTTDPPGHPDWPSWGPGPSRTGALIVGYTVEFPVNIVLTPTSLEIYSRIHRLLMSLRYTTWLLEDACTSFKVNRERESTLEAWDRRLSTCRFELQHFVATVRRSMQQQILTTCWKEFQTRLEKVDDLDGLCVCHKMYLEAIAKICFLNEESYSVLESLHEALSATAEFSVLLKRWQREENDDLINKLTLSMANASKSVQIWFAVTRQLMIRDNEETTQPEDFSFILDFNGYYSNLCAQSDIVYSTPVHN